MCTSVAGQITLILRSLSLLSPSQPKNHVYYRHRQPLSSEVERNRTMSVLSSITALCIRPLSPKRRGAFVGSNAVFPTRTIAGTGSLSADEFGKVPSKVKEWVRGSSLMTRSNLKLLRAESVLGADGSDMVVVVVKEENYILNYCTASYQHNYSFLPRLESLTLRRTALQKRVAAAETTVNGGKTQLSLHVHPASCSNLRTSASTCASSS